MTTLDGSRSDCAVCRSTAGVERISPGVPIYAGRWWVVEHAYPVSLPGWLVIVLRRHAEALHQLTAAEATELGALQRAAAHILRSHLACLKEYVICFGEADGFAHLHVHVVPRTKDLDAGLRGRNILACLSPGEDVLLPQVVADICEVLSNEFNEEMSAG